MKLKYLVVYCPPFFTWLLQCFPPSSFTLNSFLSFPHWSSTIMPREAWLLCGRFQWNLRRLQESSSGSRGTTQPVFLLSRWPCLCGLWSCAGSLWWPAATGQARNSICNTEAERRNLVEHVVLRFGFLFVRAVASNLNLHRNINLKKLHIIKHKYNKYKYFVIV